MHSIGVLDRQVHVSPPDVRELLVLWQHPRTREFVPIGRFGYDGRTYSFSYTRAAAALSDFRPLPTFGDLHRRYEIDRMPTIFGQRVMSAGRPDFADYARSLGLEPGRTTPWRQIVRSGGVRAGDTLQFMEVPSIQGGRVCARFFVNGLRYVPERERDAAGRRIRVSAEEQEGALARLEPGDLLAVEAENDNESDRWATLMTSEGIPLGWVPRLLAPSFRELLSSTDLTATVVRIGGQLAPSHSRLVAEVDVDVDAPSGFRFDRDNLWRPLGDLPGAEPT